MLFSIVVLVALMGSPAVAQRRYPPGPPTVLPTVITRPVVPKPPVAGPAVETAPETDVLPFTGADVTMFLVGGTAAIATGTTLVRIARRRNR